MSRILGRRPLAAVTALIAAAALVAGCSGGGSATDTSSTPAGNSTTAGSSSAETSGGSSAPGASSSEPGGSSSAPGESSSGTGSAEPSSPPKVTPSGSYTLGVTSYFLQHLMPGNSGGSNVNSALFTPLTVVDPKTREVRNAVAESITSDDNKVWDITLKDGWKFSNGEPVTAQSFADSWNATANPKNAMTGNLDMSIFAGYADMNPAQGDAKATTLSGVEVVDDLHLKVTLDKPNALFPSRLSGSTFAPIPTEAAKDFAAFDLNPIGNGPYMVTGGGMKAGAQQVVLEPNPNYIGDDPAHAASVTIKSYQDSTAIYTDFQAGAIDLALVDGNDLTQAKAEYPDQVVDVNYPAVVYLGFPTWDPRFDNIKVRQAISLAIDRQTIIDALLKGNATVAQGVAPESLPGGGQTDCEYCTLDVDKAKSLLADGGGWSGPLTLYSYSDPTNEAVMGAIANQLRSNLGIDATSETQPVDQLYKNFADKSLKGAFLLYSGTNIAHLYGEVSALFTPGVLNASAYSSDKVTALLDEALNASSPDEFTAKVQEASKTALADMPIAPLYYPVGGLLHSTKLSGVQPELLGGADLAAVQVSG
ncbi:MAG TPA: ABC transporter substrate-binding protein [Nakamurella sp.]|nr:ABC transporter substrate-binding protein [Nakamurella sp.]